MKLLPTVALSLFAAMPAISAGTMLDFETVTSFASVGEYYNAGADGAGNVGPALGVSFGGDVLGLMNDALGPYFSNAPSPLGVMAPVGPDSTLNVASGFTTGLVLFYSSSTPLLNAVQVWSGTDGTGSLLVSFDLAANAQSGCSDSPFCRFDPLFSTFGGTAHSVTFGDAANTATFDNITIGGVPEPSAMLLMALGLAGLVAVRRRN